MPNVALRPKPHVSAFRKISIGTWRTMSEATIYGAMTLEMDEALAYLEAFRERTGRHLTVTHLMARACAGVLAALPDANAVLRFKKLYLREHVSLFFQVALTDPATGEIDLSGVTLHDADALDLLEVHDRFRVALDKVRTHTDENLEQTRSTFGRLPGFLVGPLLSLVAFLTYTLNLDLRRLGIARDAFGSAMITNIGSLGLDEAYAPLVPFSRVPIILAMGAVQEVPVVQDGAVVVRRQMRCFASMDHRVVDGAHAAHMARELKAWFEDPWTRFGPIPGHDPDEA